MTCRQRSNLRYSEGSFAFGFFDVVSVAYFSAEGDLAVRICS